MNQTLSTASVKVSLKLDKLTLLAGLKDPEGCTEYLWHLMSDAPTRSKFGLTPARAEKPYRFALCGMVPAGTSPFTWSDGAGFHLSLHPRTEGVPYARLDLNPEGLTPHGQRHIEETFAKVMLIDLRSDLLPVALKRVDAALDLHGVAIGDLIWDRRGSVKRKLYAGKDGVESLCFGSPKAAHTVVYDKRAQLKIGGSVPITRVEYRCLHRQSLDAALSMQNPFKRLLVCPPHGLKLAPPHRQAFAAHARAEGLSRALAAFPPSAAADRKAELEDATPSWWRPADLWPAWPDILRAAVPFLYASKTSKPANAPAPLSAAEAEQFIAAM